MTAAEGAGGDTVPPSAEASENAFSEALRSAISESGLSLDRIQARLSGRGISVSVTALSYWQSGKRHPERQSSISAVRALEDILGIDSGALLGLLPAPRPRGTTSRRRRRTGNQAPHFQREVLQPLLERIGAPNALRQHQQLDLVSLHDRCDIAADGGQRAARTRAVFQASADGADRWLLVYDQGDPAAAAPTLRALRNCRVGRTETDPENALTVAELLFGRELSRGDTHLIEYSLSNSGPPYPECESAHYREFRRPVREYLLEVRFDAPLVPAGCWQYSSSSVEGVFDRRPLAIDDENGVHAVALDFGPGIFGIQWEHAPGAPPGRLS